MTAEQFGSLFNIALLDLLADEAAGDLAFLSVFVKDFLFPDHMDLVAVLRSACFEERGISLRLIPEGTVRAHDDIRRVHALDQNGAQKILCGDAHGFPVHRIGKDIVEAEVPKACQMLVAARNRILTDTGENGLRIRTEGQDRRFPMLLLRDAEHVLEDELVAEMAAVELSEGNDSRLRDIHRRLHDTDQLAPRLVPGDLLDGPAVGDLKLSDTRTLQRRHRSTTAELLPDVLDQCTDIGALRAGDGHPYVWQFNAVDRDVVDGDAVRLPLDDLSLSGEVVELLSVYLFRTVHRWNLVIRANEALRGCAELLFADTYRMLAEDRSGRVLGIGRDAELHLCFIDLFRRFDRGNQLRRRTGTDHQYTLGHRVEGSGMSYFLFMKDGTKLLRDVEARPALLLINIDNSVHSFLTADWIRNPVHPSASKAPS